MMRRWFSRPGSAPACGRSPTRYQADGAGARPAGDGAHRRPARPPRLRRGDRQPALLPGDDPRATSATALDPTASRSELLGTAGGVRNVRRVPRRRAVPGDLRRRAHRHRPAARSPRATEARRDRHAGGQAGRRHARVRRRAARRATGRITGFQEKPAPGGGAVGPRQLRHLHVRAGDLRLLPDAAVRRLGARTSSRRCWRTTCRSTSTRSTSTGTTSARSASCARAPSTRCAASCTCEIEGEEVQPRA